MASHVAHLRAVEPPAIPDRLYFKIGDVARICGVETYVLRFWETQFPQLRPGKSGTGQRLYRKRDVETAVEIKRLVHGEGFTIAGARHALAQMHRHRLVQTDERATTTEAPSASLAQVKSELREIARLLASPDPQPHRRRNRLVAMPALTDSLFPM